MCSMVQGFQIFKQNWIILICSKVIAFLVILWSPHGPCHPHVVPSSPCHPHIIPIIPTSSHVVPTPHGCGLYVVSVVSTPCGSHISVVPMSSLWSPHHPCHPHIIPTSFQRSLLHPHTPIYPPHPLPTSLGVGSRISKISIRFELIEIFQFCLKIWNLWRLPHLCVGAWVGWWVVWVNGWVHSQIINNWINLDLIGIIQFCLKICDLLRHPHLWVGVWVVGWMGGSMPGARSNTEYQVNLDLIERIQFCLKIYDGSMGGSMGRVMSNH